MTNSASQTIKFQITSSMHVRSVRLIIIINFFILYRFYEARHSESMPSRLCPFIFDKQMEKQKPQK